MIVGENLLATMTSTALPLFLKKALSFFLLNLSKFIRIQEKKKKKKKWQSAPLLSRIQLSVHGSLMLF